MPAAKPPSIRYPLLVRPPELLAKLQAVAALEGVTTPDLINSALAKLVAQKERKHGAALASAVKARLKARGGK